jgi:hypothetical protein
MPPATPDPRDHETHPPEDPLANMAVRQARIQFRTGRRVPVYSPTLFSNRLKRIHEKQSRLASQAGATIDYTVEELRQLVQRKVSASGCPFCRRELSKTAFAVTYKNPPRRGGRHALANLIVCCRPCRAIKGLLDGQEFQELAQLMRTWPEPIRRQFSVRLLRGRRRSGPFPPEAPRAA